MSGTIWPKTCCDRECAYTNACEIGGVACDRCGNYFCAYELDEDGHCDECASEIEEEERAEEEQEELNEA